LDAKGRQKSNQRPRKDKNKWSHFIPKRIVLAIQGVFEVKDEFGMAEVIRISEFVLATPKT